MSATEHYSSCNGDQLSGNNYSNQVHPMQSNDKHELHHGHMFISDEISSNSQSLTSHTLNENRNFKRTDTAKVVVVPYKRQKKNLSSDFNGIHLLQTPLLSSKK